MLFLLSPSTDGFFSCLVHSLIALVFCQINLFAWQNSQSRAAILSFPLSVTASFAEYRGNHFHNGIDFSTGGRNGHPVFAVASGQVYRVKRSRFGTGNTVYLRHNDGSIAVYAHLLNFIPNILELLPDITKNYEADIFPTKQINIAQGETIGSSGESGSGLSHLHFELRNATNQPIAVAPEDFGILDAKSPVFKRIFLCPYLRDDPVRIIEVSEIKKDSVIEIEGPIGVQVEGYDLVNNSYSRCHIPEWHLYSNQNLLFRLRTDLLTFNDNPAVSTVFNRRHTDLGPSSYVYKLYRDFYSESPNILQEHDYGVLRVGLHRISIVASDFSGNTKEISFHVLVKKSQKKEHDQIRPLPYTGLLRFSFDNFQLIFPKDSFSTQETLSCDKLVADDLPGNSIFVDGISLQPSFLFWHKKGVLQYPKKPSEKLFFLTQHGVSNKWHPLKTEFLPTLIRTNVYFATDIILALDEVSPLIGSTVFRQNDSIPEESYYVQIIDEESGVDGEATVLQCDNQLRTSYYDDDRSWLRFDARGCNDIQITSCDKTGNCADKTIKLK